MVIRITGTGSYIPSKVLTNEDLEKMVDTSDEWIITRTGIKERRIADKNVPTSDLAVEAIKNALQNAGLEPKDIDLMTVASISHDKIFPSTSCILQGKIGAENAACFDLQAACSGLLFSLEAVRSMMTINDDYNTAVVIGAEKLSSIVDWDDRSTCVLFGDGAAALVLQKKNDAEDSFLASKIGSAGKYEKLLHIPSGGSLKPASHESLGNHEHFLKMEGQGVFKLAVNSMVKACRTVLEKSGVQTDEIKWLVPHQANFRILNAVASRLKIPVEKVYMNVDRFGNTSAASIGLCLDEMNRGKHMQKGDYILLTAFGGGLTWGATLIKW